MTHIIALGNKKYVFSKEEFANGMNWFFGAMLGFIGVVLIYQLLVGLLSRILGYETHIHFGKVDSLPAAIQFWSNSKVLILYAFPPVLLLLLSVITLLNFIFRYNEPQMWKWIGFWFMVFGTLISTTLLSSCLLSSFILNRSFFQGFAVVKLWFGFSAYWSMTLLMLAIGINIIFGFMCSPVLLSISPSAFILNQDKKSPGQIVKYSFIFPLLLLLPVAAVITPRVYLPFFVTLFFHAIFWLPGLFNISPVAVWERNIRKEFYKKYNYFLILLTLFVMFIVRVFFK